MSIITIGLKRPSAQLDPYACVVSEGVLEPVGVECYCEDEEGKSRPGVWKQIVGVWGPVGWACVRCSRQEVGANVLEFFQVRHIETKPYETPQVSLVDWLATIWKGIEGLDRTALLYADITGAGTTWLDPLLPKVGRVMPVYFNHSDRRQSDLDESHYGENARVTLGKGYLVARLQVLLETGRLRLPSSPEGKAIGRELRDYQLEAQVEPEKYGGFRAGGQYDALISALGLAVQVDSYSEDWAEEWSAARDFREERLGL